MRALVWFRSDLRVADNPALYHACRAATRGVLAVFVVCPRQWRTHDWANTKVEFLLRNLACLAERLKRLNIALRIVDAPGFDDVPRLLHRLATQYACDALFYNCEYEFNEARRDAAVAQQFGRAGLVVHGYHDQAVVPPGELHTGAGRCYSVFTPFRRAWLARLDETGPPDLLPLPRQLPEPICASDPVPESVTGFDLARGHPDLWPAGENAAGRRLATFIAKHIGAYPRSRDFPAVEGTSGLSPYLATGVISARTCLQAAADANDRRLAGGRPGPERWIGELIWRDFCRHVLVGFPRVSMGRALKPETECLPWRRDEKLFKAWCAGRTGFPIVDAGMRQLAATGWMHNRLRMIVAMFLTKDLFIDWRWGEQHFMRHLIDGDLASNNGGWQWAASTGTDAVPYFRVFNPLNQSRKYDPDGEYIRRWVPELRACGAPNVHAGRSRAQAATEIEKYPEPICDHDAARRHALAAFAALRR